MVAKPVAIHTPFTAKHPVAKLKLLANVEVALPPTFKLCAESPPANVDVEFVPNTLRNPCTVDVPVMLLWSDDVAEPFAKKSEPPSVMLPVELILLFALKKFIFPELFPWIVRALVVVALMVGLTPPKIRLPEVRAGS